MSKKYYVLVLILLIEIILFLIRPDISIKAWTNSFHFSLNVLCILPPVLLLIALLEAWLPSDAIKTYLGKESGTKGIFLATLLGSFAAGPLFSAFPIASSFLNKGGRIANTVIFLGSWASIKVPLLILESRFLGMKFSLIRLAVTVPLIILIGIVMEKLTHAKPC